MNVCDFVIIRTWILHFYFGNEGRREDDSDNFEWQLQEGGEKIAED